MAKTSRQGKTKERLKDLIWTSGVWLKVRTMCRTFAAQMCKMYEKMFTPQSITIRLLMLVFSLPRITW